MVDYALEQPRQRGARSSKVFKLRKLTLRPGEEVTLTKRHRFAKLSSRQTYAGRYGIDVLVNGRARAHVEFDLAP